MKDDAVCYTIEEDLKSEFYALYKELGSNVELAKKQPNLPPYLP